MEWISSAIAQLRSIASRLRSLSRGVLRRDAVEAEMREEFRHHIEMRTEDLIRDGLSPDQASRQAQLEFGHVETHRDSARASRGLHWLDQIRFSWLDVKLGFRMLLKYPFMTMVSGLAMAVTIAIGIGTFSVFQDFLLRPDIPLPEGERVVSLGLRTTDTNRTQRRLLHEFPIWRSELETLNDVSIWRNHTANLVTADGRVEVERFTMMSASGFRVARIPPLLGRPLLEADEVEGAPPVVVLGHDEWMTRFSGDPEVVGSQIQIGRELHTIVGVMPEGFSFPYSEKLWIPFTDDPDDYPRMEGPPAYFAFGRLAPGVTLDQAQAEMAAITARRAADYPDTHAHIRGQVMHYTDAHTGMDDVGEDDLVFVRVILGVMTLLVLIPFANVAILVYARTATRAGEIGIRSALGASRVRVVMQLFMEALVLATLSAAAGVGIALFALDRADHFMDVYFRSGLPFWAELGHDPWVIAYAVGLTVLAAVVAGVVPGLQATGKGVQAVLKRAAGGGRLSLGRLWTALVITQVAISVAFLPVAAAVASQNIGMAMARPTFAADEYLSAAVAVPPGLSPSEEPGAAGAAFSELIDELVRRLEADPRVTAVTMSSRNPEPAFVPDLRIEVEGVDPPPDRSAHRVERVAVAEDFFEVLDVPVEGGHAFISSDADDEAPSAVVNRAFVRQILGGANPVGRRVREAARPDTDPAPWREIVGFIEELGENPLYPERVAPTIFVPLDQSSPPASMRLIVHVPAATEDFGPTLQRIASGVDPALILSSIMPLDAPSGPNRAFGRAVAFGIGFVLLSILLLTSAGVFALMSFNVTQRRREIGIRSALGAQPRRVLAGVMGRSAMQLGIGIAVGLALASAVPDFSVDGFPVQRDPRLFVVVAVIMVLVGLSAAAGPVRRGLRIQPTEALREEV